MKTMATLIFAAALVGVGYQILRPTMPDFSSYCRDMSQISITQDLETLAPGSRQQFTDSCIAAAIRTWRLRNLGE
jgi:hypothetical protein